MSDQPARQILEWYDLHARRLPWRVPPDLSRAGHRPDPYHIWLSEIMLQQTTVAAVIPYFTAFTERWPRVMDLAAAEDADVMSAWAGLGYYARARNLLKCARVVAHDLDGLFPTTEEELRKLPGIGPYTAAAIAAIAFGVQATVVDGNVERVMARLNDIRTPMPDAKPSLRTAADRLTPIARAGDYAQAVMDLGATICTPRSPACGLCPWMADCLGRTAGSAADLPAKAPKKPKPLRRGIVYLARRPDGGLLFETRPEKGLLGGMLGLPGSDWTEDDPRPQPPLEAEWRDAAMEVRHTFTHFHLILTVMVAQVPDGAKARQGRFYAAGEVTSQDLPTVMRKALKAGLSALEGAD